MAQNLVLVHGFLGFARKLGVDYFRDLPLRWSASPPWGWASDNGPYWLFASLLRPLYAEVVANSLPGQPRAGIDYPRTLIELGEFFPGFRTRGRGRRVRGEANHERWESVEGSE